MKITEYNAMTGITVVRDMTAEEIAQMEAMQNEVQPETQPTPQPTLEQRITDIEQVTEEVITILKDKGIAP